MFKFTKNNEKYPLEMVQILFLMGSAIPLAKDVETDQTSRVAFFIYHLILVDIWAKIRDNYKVNGSNKHHVPGIDQEMCDIWDYELDNRGEVVKQLAEDCDFTYK